MARRRSPRSRSRGLRRALPLALIVVAVIVWAAWGERLRPALGLGGEPVPSKGAGLRVITWNLRNFTGDPATHDLARLRHQIDALAPDVWAVQEIVDPAAFAALVRGWDPKWELALSQAGGRGHQLLGVVYDATRVELVGEAREHGELGLDGRVRPALSVYLRTRDGELDLHLLVVHLKAMRDGYELRRQQWDRLAAIVAELEPRADEDLVVLGDFNATGPEQGGPAQELAAVEARLSAASLRRVATPAGCSEYWDGSRRDAWQEPSLLDLVFVRGLARELGEAPRLHAGAHCATHSCAAFRSSAAYPEPDFALVSDHCPLVLDLAAS